MRECLHALSEASVLLWFVCLSVCLFLSSRRDNKKSVINLAILYGYVIDCSSVYNVPIHGSLMEV